MEILDGGMFMDKEKLQELLKGKTIERADLSHGTVNFFSMTALALNGKRL